MSVRLAPVLAAALLATGAPASARAPVAGGLAVWPARLTVTAGASAVVHVSNRSRRPVSLTVRAAGLALDLRGGPRIVRSSAGTPLLAVRPTRLVVAPRGAASVALRAAGRRLAPGDRPALVVLSAASGGGAGIGVRVRIGVPVEVRTPGTMRRRLALGALHARRRRLELLVWNRGNVTERVVRGSVVVEVRRGARLLAVLQPRPRDLLPRSRGLLEFRVPARLHGRLTLVASAPRPPAARRSYAVVL